MKKACGDFFCDLPVEWGLSPRGAVCPRGAFSPGRIPKYRDPSKLAVIIDGGIRNGACNSSLTIRDGLEGIHGGKVNIVFPDGYVEAVKHIPSNPNPTAGTPESIFWLGRYSFGRRQRNADFTRLPRFSESVRLSRNYGLMDHGLAGLVFRRKVPNIERWTK